MFSFLHPKSDILIRILICILILVLPSTYRPLVIDENTADDELVEGEVLDDEEFGDYDDKRGYDDCYDYGG